MIPAKDANGLCLDRENCLAPSMNRTRNLQQKLFEKSVWDS